MRVEILWQKIFVATYYKYVPIENAGVVADHLAFCKSIGLKGRILGSR